MQFNLVASSNKGAVRLWEAMGFQTAGILPDAFRHPRLGFVDAYVMYKHLEPAVQPESSYEARRPFSRPAGTPTARIEEP
jgi:hypothetical protein